MRLLLDTCTLLWWLSDDPKLGTDARRAIRRETNEVYASAASAWEISIKKALGKLEAPADLASALTSNRFRALDITLSHALRAGQLPRHQDDPFDRMLIAQAQEEHLTIVTHDVRFKLYKVPLVLSF